MKSKKFIVPLFCISIILLILASLYPYIFIKHDFLIGFDSGVYSYELIKYNGSLDKINAAFSLWSEPGIFVLSSIIGVITGLNTDATFLTIFILILIMTSLICFIYCKKLTEKDSISLLCVFIAITSITQISPLYHFFLKQAVSFMVYLIFLYILTFFQPNKSKTVVLIILSTFILFSHRAISFLWVFTLIISSLVKINKKEKSNSFKESLLIFISSIIFISGYLIPIIKDQARIFKEFLENSYLGLIHQGTLREVAGDKIVSSTLSLNPLLDYLLFSGFITIFLILGVFSLKIKKREQILIFSNIVFFSTFAFLGLTFGSRFIYNLDFFAIVISSLFLLQLFSISPNKLRAVIIFLVIVISMSSSIGFVLKEKPYLKDNLESIKFINENIEKNNSIIISSDFVQTSLAQKGYVVPIVYDPLQYNYLTKKNDRAALDKSDDFLIDGYSNVSLLYNYNLLDKEVYVLIDSWYINNNLPRSSSNSSINLLKWDNSSKYELIYKNDNDQIIRIYRLK